MRAESVTACPFISALCYFSHRVFRGGMDVKLDQIVLLAVEGQEGLLRTLIEKHLHVEISMFRRTRRISVMVRCDVTRLEHIQV